jgi:uncharacterized protein (TIGR02646 family)
MIKVDRTKVPAPTILTAKGKEELKRAEAHYTKQQSRKARGEKVASFSFAVYSMREVKAVLEELFHGKCAYCESRYAATQPMDVEHWRPKGKVVEDDGTEVWPGYYWLAAHWENLLPSCIDCNRERQQTVLPDGTVKTLGKANQFPLRDCGKRALRREDLDGEEPLLLDPCGADDPAEHMEFMPDGDLRARPDSTGAKSAKGKASIKVFALNRSALVLERRQVLRLLEHRKAIVDRLIALLDEPRLPQRIASLVEELLSHEIEGLRRAMDPDQPFSLMVSQVLRPYLKSLDLE